MSSSQFIDDCVGAMNVYRDRHQVPELRHNADLGSTAQTWADRLASSGSLSHNPNASYRGERLGENCAMRWTSDRQGCTGNDNDNDNNHNNNHDNVYGANVETSHCVSSPGSFDECRLSAGWPPTRPNLPVWAVCPPK